MSRPAAKAAFLLVLLGVPARAAGPERAWCGTTRTGTERALWEHRVEDARRGALRAATFVADVGEIAVLKDEGDLILPARALDLQGVGLEFRAGSAGFTLSRVDRPVVAEAGARLALTDDSNVALALPFAFSFYGKSYTQVFVNSDGNLTFGRGESASTARDLGRFLGGPPRIAPLFADLNPGDGGSVTTFGD